MNYPVHSVDPVIGQCTSVLNYPDPFSNITDTDGHHRFVPNTNVAKTSAFQSYTQQQLVEFQQYHFVSGQVAYSSLLTDGKTLKTVQGGEITITVQNGSIYVNAAKIVGPDYLISNGVFHVLDKYSCLQSSVPAPMIVDTGDPQLS
jgi:hypothetical protein